MALLASPVGRRGHGKEVQAVAVSDTAALLCFWQGGPLGVLPGHLADHLQCAGAPPRPDEGEAAPTLGCTRVGAWGQCRGGGLFHQLMTINNKNTSETDSKKTCRNTVRS